MAWNMLPFGMIQRISPRGPAAAVLAQPFPRRAFSGSFALSGASIEAVCAFEPFRSAS